MGSNSYSTYRAPPCPGCGKGLAFMGSSAWGHMMPCCGEACGLKVRDTLAEMREDERCKYFTLTIQHANDQLSLLKQEYLAGLRELPDEMANANIHESKRTETSND